MTTESDELARLQSMTDDEQTVYILTDIIEQETARHQEMLLDWKDGYKGRLTEARALGRQIRVWTRKVNEAKARLEERGLNDKPSQS